MNTPIERVPLKILISSSKENHTDCTAIKDLILSSRAFQVVVEDPANSIFQNPFSRTPIETEVFLLLISQSYEVPDTINTLVNTALEKFGAALIPVILDDSQLKSSTSQTLDSVRKIVKQSIKWYADPEKAGIELLHTLESLAELRERPQAVHAINEAKDKEEAVLNLSGYHLKRIPRDLLDMPWLTELQLQSNDLEELENLENLANLERLNLSKNRISSLEKLKPLKALKYVDLERNEITDLKGLDSCTGITTLGLSANKFESLSGIEHLTKLETLYASRNKLKDVSHLKHLHQLRRVVLSDNYITSIRPLLDLLEKDIPIAVKYSLNPDETGIFVKGNPISDPPIEVIAFGKDSILSHFQKSDTYGEKRLDVLKLVLIGNSGVGKTNFSEYLRNLTITTKHASTDTLDIYRWETPILKSESGAPVRVNIFDFGGQDYYHDLHRLFYSHDTAYVLIWDTATNSYSDNETEKLGDGSEIVYENFPLEYWLESIKYNLHGKEAHIRKQSTSQNGKETESLSASQGKDTLPAEPADASVVDRDLATTAPVLVLQNKIDLGEGLLNQVAMREKYNNITTFFNVSLTSGKRVKILDEVLQDCLNKLNLAGRKLVSYQHDVIEKYLETEVDFEVLPLLAFRDKCASLVPEHKDLLDVDDARTIASILTNLGVLYFDQSDTDDGGIVFTHIGHLSLLIKQVMKAAKEGKETDKGFFLKKDLKGIDHIEHVLPLLLKNSSVIELGTDQFLVPQFLPLNAEPSMLQFSRAFAHCQIRYVYTGYFHKSLLMSLFARYLSNQASAPENSQPVRGIYFWRNGLILSRESESRPSMIFVSFVKEAGSCRIEIRSLYPFQQIGLEREVERELDKYNVGLNPRKEVSVNSRDFFDVSDLIRQVSENDFIFRKGNEVFTVNDFKHLVPFTKVPKKLFISYSSKNAEFVKRFWTHLSVLQTKGYIEPWYDRKIEPGSKWDESIQKEMQSADLVVFLLSPDFLATPYIMNVEVKKAIEMADKQQCELFFVQLLQCSWNETDLDKFQMLLNPAEAGKKQHFIGTPDNDEAWKTTIDTLTLRVKSE